MMKKDLHTLRKADMRCYQETTSEEQIFGGRFLRDLQQGVCISLEIDPVACFLIYLPLKQKAKDGADWHRLLPGNHICRQSPYEEKRKEKSKIKGTQL